MKYGIRRTKVQRPFKLHALLEVFVVSGIHSIICFQICFRCSSWAERTRKTIDQRLLAAHHMVLLFGFSNWSAAPCNPPQLVPPMRSDAYTGLLVEKGSAIRGRK